MTVAQLVRPALGFAGRSHQPPLQTLRRAVFGRPSGDAAMWRSIVTGLTFAMIGLLMMAVALGAAGVASPSSSANAGAPDVVQTVPARHAVIYQNPAEALTDAMPVP